MPMSHFDETLVTRELRLIKIPEFPLALSVALVLALVYLVMALVGKAGQLMQQAQPNEVRLTTLGVLRCQLAFFKALPPQASGSPPRSVS